MSLTKEQWQKIGGIVITALLAVAAVLGWFFPVGPGETFGAMVREKISIDARDDVLLYNGADQYVYSDDHSSQVLHIDGATGNIDSEGTLALASTLTLENGETLVNSVDNTITVTVGATGTFAVAVGNLQVGDGTPGLTLNGEDTYVAGTLEADGATDLGSTLALAGTLTQSDGDVVIADDVRVISQTLQTVTNGDAFTATGTYQEITAAGEVTPTITVGTVGDLLVLINVGSQTINVADTGIQMLSAAWAAGQYDVLVLWCDGTNWIEISRSDN